MTIIIITKEIENTPLKKGVIVEVGDGLAKDMIRQGNAELYIEEKEVEESKKIKSTKK